jgi:hypothetical protein
VVAFFDPKDETVTLPLENVPASSCKINDETKRRMLSGRDVLNQAGLAKQIKTAELQKLTYYFLTLIPGMPVSTRSSTA